MAEGKGLDNVEFIDVIEPVLDNQAFMLAVVGGVALGIIAVYGWMEYQKSHPRTGGMTPEPMQYIETAQDEAHEGQTVEAPNVPVWPQQ